MKKIVDSGLVEAAAFPQSILCPELVQECINRYDPQNRCVKNANGDVLFSVNRQTLMSVMKIPHKGAYSNLDITSSNGYFSEKKPTYKSVIARNWLLKFQKGGSRLPRPLTRDHLIQEVRDIVVLLNRLRGNQHAYYWEDWMYFFIQVVLQGEQYLDWAEIIADCLHQSLNNRLGNRDFFMSSYLFYCLASTRDWFDLPHEPLDESSKVYQYYSQLQRKNCYENYKRINDVFTGKMTYELTGNPGKRMTSEAMQLISIYGSFFIQFSEFTYIRVGGFDGEPMKLPRYVFDRFIRYRAL